MAATPAIMGEDTAAAPGLGASVVGLGGVTTVPLPPAPPPEVPLVAGVVAAGGVVWKVGAPVLLLGVGVATGPPVLPAEKAEQRAAPADWATGRSVAWQLLSRQGRAALATAAWAAGAHWQATSVAPQPEAAMPETRQG